MNKKSTSDYDFSQADDQYEELEVFYGPVTEKEIKISQKRYLLDETMIHDAFLHSSILEEEENSLQRGSQLKQFLLEDDDDAKKKESLSRKCFVDSDSSLCISDLHSEIDVDKLCDNLPRNYLMNDENESRNAESVIEGLSELIEQQAITHFDYSTGDLESFPKKIRESFNKKSEEAQRYMHNSDNSSLTSNDRIEKIDSKENLDYIPNQLSANSYNSKICTTNNQGNFVANKNDQELHFCNGTSVQNSVNLVFEDTIALENVGREKLYKSFPNSPQPSPKKHSFFSLEDLHGKQTYGSIVDLKTSKSKDVKCTNAPTISSPNVDNNGPFNRNIYQSNDLNESFNGSNLNFNDTLEEVEMLLKLSKDYEGSKLSHSYLESKVNDSFSKIAITPDCSHSQDIFKDLQSDFSMTEHLTERKKSSPSDSYEINSNSYESKTASPYCSFQSNLTQLKDFDDPPASPYASAVKNLTKLPLYKESKTLISENPPIHPLSMKRNQKSSLMRAKEFSTPQPSRIPLSQKGASFWPSASKKYTKNGYLNGLSIVSPVAKYLKENPPPPLITTVKPKYRISPLKRKKEYLLEHKPLSKLPCDNVEEKKFSQNGKAPNLPPLMYTSGNPKFEDKENLTVKNSPKPLNSVIKHKGRVRIPKNHVSGDFIYSHDTELNSTSSARVSLMEVSIHEPHSLQHSNTLKQNK